MDDLTEFGLWFALFSLLGGAALLGIGTGFLWFGLGASSQLVAVVSYLAAAYFDLNGLALCINGLYVGWQSYKA